jgi:uncharacterized membrane protein YoaK (UPF0700 family)
MMSGRQGEAHRREAPLKRYDRPVRLFAAVLAALAGYVDAVGFLMTGGFFVSFMSGNSTRLAAGVAEGAGYAALAAGLLIAFVAGVTIASLLARVAGRRRPAAVLFGVAALLVAAAILAAVDVRFAAILVLAFAMGAENTVFAEDGEVRIGLTYMTGALVKLGKSLAVALTGGDRFGWAPYLLLWFGLAAGAVAGAVVYDRLGPAALWVPAGLMAVAATAALRLRLSPA